jgi:hypothetical protein
MQVTTSPELNNDYEAVYSMLEPIFEFSDNYFHDASVDLPCSSISDNWFDLIEKYWSNYQGFKILHLNVKSIFNKEHYWLKYLFRPHLV